MYYEVEKIKLVMKLALGLVCDYLENSSISGEKTENSSQKGGCKDISDVKKCVDITRDLTDVMLKLVKYEKDIEQYGGADKNIFEREQDIYDIVEIFDELRAEFNPDLFKSMVDMESLKVMEIIREVIIRKRVEKDEHQRKIAQENLIGYQKTRFQNKSSVQ